MAKFKNKYLSYSRLSRYEQCPLSFKLHYIEKRTAEPGAQLRFGTTVHSTLERLVREHVDANRVGPLSETRALELFREAWTEGQLVGADLFQDGCEILRRFVRDQGELNGEKVLSLEQKFELHVGRFKIIGFIDRVDRVDEDAIEIIDYKTNRQPYTREEVDSNLQLSLYCLAAQKLWPWAKKIRLTFYLLRLGIRQKTERTPDQLEAARAYLETLGKQTEEATEFPARIGTHCVWCDHKRHCPAYEEALKTDPQSIGETEDDLEAIARERERVASIAKILYARKEELESTLKAHLAERGDLTLGGVRYALTSYQKASYPLKPTLQILSESTGDDQLEIAQRVAMVDPKALKAILQEIASADDARARRIKGALDAIADKTAHARLLAKKLPQTNN